MPKGKYNRKHHGGGGNQGGGGGGGKNAGLGELSTITETATGKGLVKLARAMAKVEIKPQVRAYRRLVKELKGQQAADTIGLTRLGQQTQSDIQGAANAYDVGAQGATARTQAVGGMLQSQLQQQGQQAAASQQTAQTGALGGLQESMALQGAPQGGAAQAALGQLVAQQNARQAADTQAGQQFASSQQGSYGGLLEGMRTAGSLQASTSRQQSSRDIASRIAEMRLQAGQDIREAAGKKADVKATKGALMLTKLAELRAAERDYDLGRRATSVDKRGQDIAAATAAAGQATTRRGQDITAQTADENRAASQEDGGSGAGRENRQEAAVDRRNALGAAKDLYHTGKHAGDVEWYQTHFAAYVEEIKSRASVPYATAREMAKKFLQRHAGGSTTTSGGGPAIG